jgi:hypothetical protein
MKYSRLKQLYCQHLIRFGVERQKAEKAAETITEKELFFIAQIWPDWSTTYYSVDK